MSLKWDDSLSIGNMKIDQQHKDLVNTLNKVYEATKEGKGREEAVNALLFLEKYVVQHFHDEEQIQLKSRYPEYQIHKEQHNIFKNNLSEIKTIYQEQGASLVFMSKLNLSVSQWIITHIKGYDKKLGKFLATSNPK